MVDTLVLPAAFSYSGSLAEAAAQAKAAGIKAMPQVDAANEIGALIDELQRAARRARRRRSTRPSACTTTSAKQAELLTSDGRRRDGGGARGVRRARARRSPTTAGRCRSTGRCCSRCNCRHSERSAEGAKSRNRNHPGRGPLCRDDCDSSTSPLRGFARNDRCLALPEEVRLRARESRGASGADRLSSRKAAIAAGSSSNVASPSTAARRTLGSQCVRPS